MNDFGTIVRSCRVALGLSQGQVAAERGRTRPWLSQVEAGLREPSLDDVAWLMWRLGFTLSAGPDAELLGDCSVVSVLRCERCGEEDTGPFAEAVSGGYVHLLECPRSLTTHEPMRAALEKLLPQVDPGGFMSNELGVAWADDGSGVARRLIARPTTPEEKGAANG